MGSAEKQNNIEKQNNNVSNSSKYDQVEKETTRPKIRIHWFIVVLALLLTFLLGFINEVSLFENLKRCFYVGSIFWIIVEIIDYILKS